MEIGEGKKGKSGEECEGSELPHQVGQSEEGAGRHDDLLVGGKVKVKLQGVRLRRSLLPCGSVAPALGKH